MTNYLSFSVNGTDTWGVARDGLVYDLGPSGADLATSLGDAVREGIFAAVSSETIAAAPSHAESSISYLPAVTDPTKILCIGVNYRTHQQETGREGQTAPTVFFRFADSQMGHLNPAVYPKVSHQYDYEGELALVIGRDSWHVPAAHALEHVAGYAAYNDFSVRDWQLAASQWGPGKTFPNSGAFGPYLVPAAELGDVTKLHLQTRVNGQVRQEASVSELVFTIPDIIEYVTTFTPLHAGDVIVTGTPGGVGMFSKPQALLSPGDEVEVEIASDEVSLGILRNPVVAEG